MYQYLKMFVFIEDYSLTINKNKWGWKIPPKDAPEFKVIKYIFISRIKPRGLPRECSAPPVFLIQFDVCRLGNKGIAPTNVNIT